MLSSDLFSSARALKDQIRLIAAGDTDIIIGTQLVAKGHNFPNLTLVGVIDADLGLQGSDLRAAEHTFQLMRQVAGRAGRAAKKGVALLQTYQPEHPVIRAIIAGDEEGFWRAGSCRTQNGGGAALRPHGGDHSVRAGFASGHGCGKSPCADRRPASTRGGASVRSGSCTDRARAR